MGTPLSQFGLPHHEHNTLAVVNHPQAWGDTTKPIRPSTPRTQHARSCQSPTRGRPCPLSCVDTAATVPAERCLRGFWTGPARWHWPRRGRSATRSSALSVGGRRGAPDLGRGSDPTRNVAGVPDVGGTDLSHGNIDVHAPCMMPGARLRSPTRRRVRHRATTGPDPGTVLVTTADRRSTP
jgi:hypothetical protein